MTYLNIENLIFTKQFKSRKNKVFLVEDNGVSRVLKYFNSPEILQKELHIINNITHANIACVKPVKSNESAILYEYVIGFNLCELLEKAEDGTCSVDIFPVFIDLITWLYNFHKATGSIFNDINLRNFIYSNEKIVACDFEDSDIGCLEQDYGRLIAYILTYDPMYTYLKAEIVKHILNYLPRYNTNLSVVQNHKHLELQRIQKRRANFFKWENI